LTRNEGAIYLNGAAENRWQRTVDEYPDNWPKQVKLNEYAKRVKPANVVTIAERLEIHERYLYQLIAKPELIDTLSPLMGVSTGVLESLLAATRAAGFWRPDQIIKVDQFVEDYPSLVKQSLSPGLMLELRKFRMVEDARPMWSALVTQILAHQIMQGLDESGRPPREPQERTDMMGQQLDREESKTQSMVPKKQVIKPIKALTTSHQRAKRTNLIKEEFEVEMEDTQTFWSAGNY